MNNSADFFHMMVDDKINISYTGPFDSQVLSVIAKNIETALAEDPRISKKIFKIFIELAQNIAFYSAERVLGSEGSSAGYGTLTIQEHEDHYLFATGNMAKKEDVEPVVEKCDTINSMSREQLREYKRQQRNLPPSAKGGGNIGLIQVALTADNRLDYKVIPIEESKLFYIIGVKIKKLVS